MNRQPMTSTIARLVFSFAVSRLLVASGVCIVLLTGSWSVCAQGPVFSGKSPLLTSATGWEQSRETRKWTGNKNVIDDRESPPYWAGHTDQSFNWMRFASITYNKKQYPLLLFEKQSGAYRKEATQEDWQPELRTQFLIIQDLDFALLRRLVSEKKAGMIKITSRLTGYMSDKENGADGSSLYQDKYLLARMAKTVDKPAEQDECMIVIVKVTDGKPMVRFLLPTSCFIVDNFIRMGFFELPCAEFSKVLELAQP